MAMNIISKDKKVIRWLGIPACYEQDVAKDTVVDDEEASARQILLAQIEQEEVMCTRFIHFSTVLTLQS